MSSCWLVKQLFNCFVHYFLEFSYEFQLVSPLLDFWWTLFVFSIFLITCVILRWLFCHLWLMCFPHTFAWHSCHFMSLWWQALWDLFPCAQWNFFHLSWGLFPCIWWSFLHSPLFHYSACNGPDALCTCHLPSRLPYCPHIIAQCGHSPSKCLTVLTSLPNVVGFPSTFSCSQPSAVFLHVATRLVIFIIWCRW